MCWAEGPVGSEPVGGIALGEAGRGRGGPQLGPGLEGLWILPPPLLTTRRPPAGRGGMEWQGAWSDDREADWATVSEEFKKKGPLGPACARANPPSWGGLSRFI